MVFSSITLFSLIRHLKRAVASAAPAEKNQTGSDAEQCHRGRLGNRVIAGEVVDRRSGWNRVEAWSALRRRISEQPVGSGFRSSLNQREDVRLKKSGKSDIGRWRI